MSSPYEILPVLIEKMMKLEQQQASCGYDSSDFLKLRWLLFKSPRVKKICPNPE